MGGRESAERENGMRGGMSRSVLINAAVEKFRPFCVLLSFFFSFF